MNLTDHTAHRPYPLPKGPWLMTQTWENLLFAHWPVNAAVLRQLVPATLELDTYDDQAWIGIVPFQMSNIHARGIPPIPGTAAFPELNVRTYVKHGGKAGVYFFSLDAANRLAVATARRFFHLPYFNAEMSVQVDEQSRVNYASRRTHRDAPPAVFQADYRPVSAVWHSQPGTLDHWLTERYCLYTTYQNTVYCGEIHHLPWPLQHAEAEIRANTMFEVPDGAPLLQFAQKLVTLIWPLHKLT
ncbi:YqjF family protein [Tumebacillus avium]|nr:DUF2071 domain-containing protein [Tumebacillus avium]